MDKNLKSVDPSWKSR